MLEDILVEIIGDILWNLIIKPIGALILYIFLCIFKGIAAFFKWCCKHIKAAAKFVTLLVIRALKGEGNDHVEDEVIPYYDNTGYYDSDYIDSASDLYD